MDALFLLVPISLVLVFLIGWALWWAIFNGQFDDAQREGERILEDDDRVSSETVVNPRQDSHTKESG